jgi:hypothetical protein
MALLTMVTDLEICAAGTTGCEYYVRCWLGSVGGRYGAFVGYYLGRAVWEQGCFGCALWEVGRFQSCVVGCFKEGYGTERGTR